MAKTKKPVAKKKLVKVKEVAVVEQSVSVMKRQATVATSKANELEIKDQEGYSAGEDLLKKISTVKKMVKNEKDKVLAPLLEAEKAERNRWRPIEDDVMVAEKIVRQKMGVYLNKVEEEARIKQQKIEADLESGKIKKTETAARKMDEIQDRPEMEQSGVRKVRKAYIVNPDLIPDEYWVIDEIRVRKDALAGKEIPGVEIKLENQINVLPY